jgi:hypothetical protein
MPIRPRQPETIDRVMPHRVPVARPGGADDGISVTSPGVLLSPVAPTLPASVPAPARALALDALRIARLLRAPARRPERWAQPAFAAEVELIRRHLGPDAADASPTRLAYALRWLELRDGATGPSWQCLLS